MPAADFNPLKTNQTSFQALAFQGNGPPRGQGFAGKTFPDHANGGPRRLHGQTRQRTGPWRTPVPGLQNPESAPAPGSPGP